ncbi:MAG: TonB-dependent receptor, partial [Chlorobiales bacterium]|nr:TonB-dependent receptor [Chlorobiales bacterium]
MRNSFVSRKGRHALMVAFGLLVLCNAAFGEVVQSSFKGIVIDIETNQPIADATVRIDEISRMYKTTEDGSFEIKDVAAGKYMVRVSHVGYRESRETITLSESGERRFYIFLDPKAYEAATIVVTSEHTHSKFEDITEESSVLKGKELQKELGLTLASTLKNETGLAIRSMGPAPARPVIRGLGADRVLISEDGNKTTDLSATSPDHAVTIEPFSLERIEVIRGPKAILQSPATIGGVINVVRHEIPQEQEVRITGTLGAYGETVNKGYLTSLIADVPLNPFMLRGEVSHRNTGDLSTPIGILKNSESDNLNYSLGASWLPEFGFIGASVRQFSLDYGVPGGFIGAHPNGVLIEMEKTVLNVKSRIKFNSGMLQNIETHLSRTSYRHKEFESNGSVGADFKITNVTGYANLNHEHASFFDRGTAGVSFESRKFDIGGNVFTPSSTSQNLAAYLYEAFSLGKFSFEAGARYNFDRITPDKEIPNSRIGNIRERVFHTYS